jgi:hypothetical protein
MTRLAMLLENSNDLIVERERIRCDRGTDACDDECRGQERL